MNYNLYIPENLNFQQLKKQYPTRIKGDHLLYICHSIIMAKIYNDEDTLAEKRKGYVPLSATKLKAIIRDYKPCIDYLIDAGVILCDQSYEAGVISKGYAFTEEYTGVKYACITASDYILRRNLHNKMYTAREQRSKRKRKYNHLVKWLKAEGLQIDSSGAYRWIEEHEAQELCKINEEYKTRKAREAHKKLLIDTCEGYKVIVDQIKQGHFTWSVDETGYRFHTILTRMKKELRQFLSYEGQKMVAVDISCSQPYLSLILLQKSFWKTEKKPKSLTVGKVYDIKDKTTRINESLYTIMFPESSKTLYSKDFQDDDFFTTLVTQGELYNYMKEILPLPKGEDQICMNEGEIKANIKRRVLHILYCDEGNPYNRSPTADLPVFQRAFPEVARIFSLIKSGDYKLLPALLQRIESKLVLDIICKRISKEKPDLPIFTIHDSIVTVEGYEFYTKDIMTETLAEFVGYLPNLKIEHWGRMVGFQLVDRQLQN